MRHLRKFIISTVFMFVLLSTGNGFAATRLFYENFDHVGRANGTIDIGDHDILMKTMMAGQVIAQE